MAVLVKADHEFLEIAFNVVDEFYPELSRYHVPGSDMEDPLDSAERLLEQDLFAHGPYNPVCCLCLTTLRIFIIMIISQIYNSLLQDSRNTLESGNAASSAEYRFDMCNTKSAFEHNVAEAMFPMLHFTSPALSAATARMLRVFSADVLTTLLDPQGLGSKLRDPTVFLAPMAFVSTL